ncbi:hypothetical protein [Arthrobacter sp. B3I9]|nr:hypothetical protein [Arthrobacter sp. B3I9]
MTESNEHEDKTAEPASNSMPNRKPKTLDLESFVDVGLSDAEIRAKYSDD